MNIWRACFLIVGFLSLSYGKQVYRRSHHGVWLEVNVMTWNILAPIWVDRQALSRVGINVNLLNEKMRLWRVVQEIKKKKPDILALQEVQEDIFNELRKSLAKYYGDVGLATNEKQYWRSFLADGAEYKRNGVATFYNKRKFTAETSNHFHTSESGSVAQTIVLRPKARRHHSPKPIIALNCHLETGFTQADVNVRVHQGTRVIQEAESFAREYASEDPSVLIIGDMNSMDPYNGFTNFEDHGYKDAQREVGDSTASTYFFERPFESPGGQLVYGGSIDHVFIRNSDIEKGRVRLVSTDIPSVESEEFSEESYVDYIARMIRIECRDKSVKGTKEMISHLLKSDVFSSLFNAVHDEHGKESKINRALRRGSDHLNVMVKLLLRDGKHQ